MQSLQRKHFALAGFVLIGAFALAGCGKQSAATTSHTIVIGEDDSMTGPLAVYGVAQHQAIELAVNQVNAAGGLRVKGTRYHIKLDWLNDNSNPTTATTNITKLVDQDHVQFMLGGTNGSEILPSLPLMDRNRIPWIVGVAASLRVTSEPWTYVFHTRPPGDYTGTAAGQFMAIDLGLRKVAVVGQLSTSFYLQYAQGVKLSLKRHGGSVTTMQTFSPTATDMYSQLTAAIATHPQAIFVPAYVSQAAFVYKQARQLGFKGLLMGFTGGSTQQFEKVDSPSILSGIYDLFPAELSGTHYSIFGPDAKTFLSQFQKTYHTVAAPSTGYGYDAARILFDAIQRAGTTNTAAVVRALNTMPIPRNVTLGYIPVGGHLFSHHQAFIHNVADKWYNGHWHFYKPMPSPAARFASELASMRAHNGR